MKWMWYRFHANAEDFRPVKWPALGPFWCTGYAGDDSYSTVVAYLPPDEPLKNWWPEATNIMSEPRDTIGYSDRFKKPDWWKGD